MFHGTVATGSSSISVLKARLTHVLFSEVQPQACGWLPQACRPLGNGPNYRVFVMSNTGIERNFILSTSGRASELTRLQLFSVDAEVSSTAVRTVRGSLGESTRECASQ
jgi:hypothetical protein